MPQPSPQPPNPTNLEEESSFLQHSIRQNRQQGGRQKKKQYKIKEEARVSVALIVGVMLLVVVGVLVVRYYQSGYWGNEQNAQGGNVKDKKGNSNNGVTAAPLPDQVLTSKEAFRSNNNMRGNRDNSKDPDQEQQQQQEKQQQQQTHPRTYQQLWLFKSQLPQYQPPVHQQANSVSSYNLKQWYQLNIQQHSSLPITEVSTFTRKQLIQNNRQVIGLIDKVSRISELSDELRERLLQLPIMLAVVQEFGGVVMGGDLVLTKGIEQVLQVVKKNQHKGYELYGFFGRNASVNDKDQSNQHINSNKDNTNQLTNQQPQHNPKTHYTCDLHNYFFISQPQSDLLIDFIYEITQILEQQLDREFRTPFKKSELADHETLVEQEFVTRVYGRYAEEWDGLVKQLQAEYKRENRNRLTSEGKEVDQDLELDEVYHSANLFNLNTVFSPELTPLLDLTKQSHFKYLLSIPQSQLQHLIGPLPPILRIPLYYFETYLQKQLSQPQPQIHRQSLLYQHLIKKDQIPQEQLIAQTQIQPHSPPTTFPTVAFTFIPQQLKDLTVTRYFMTNLIERCHQSNIDLIILTQDNIKHVLSQQVISYIDEKLVNILDKDKKAVYQQLVKLHTLKLYGGIFVEANQFLLESLNWVWKVNKIEHLFNYVEGKQGEVFMFYDHTKAGNWNINHQAKKQAVELQYDTRFVAAVKGSKLIKDWIQALEINVANFPTEEQQHHQQHQIKSHCRINYTDIQTYSQQVLKCLLDKKQTELNTEKAKQVQNSESMTSSNFYGILSMNSLLAGDKLTLLTENSSRNKECLSFSTSFREFTQQHGSIGLMSLVQTQATQQQLEQSIKKMPEDSILRQFFSKKKIPQTQILDRQSAQSIKSIIAKMSQNSGK